MRVFNSFFPHDSDASFDPKCMLLIDELGLEGYVIYCVLLEILREQPDYKYPLSLVSAVARRYNTSAKKVNSVVKCYQLFEINEEDKFYSPSLIRRMLSLEEIKEKRRTAANIRRNKYEK